MTYLDDIFSLMDEWRHLPSYQLERRADIFFAIYLPDILRHKLSVEPQSIIPEFPVRIGTIDSRRSNHRSYKVDYVVKLEGSLEVLFIELKTDMQSRRGKQDQYLNMSKQRGMKEILDGVQLIYSATKQKKKYKVLLHQLKKADFIYHSDPYSFKIIDKDYKIKIVYIQPRATTSDDKIVISFEDIAEILEGKQDELSQRFAISLRDWANTEPGDIALTDPNGNRSLPMN